MEMGVVGAGIMGGEIALAFALSGYSVLLHDRSEHLLDAAHKRLEAKLDKGIAKGHYADSDRGVLARVKTTSSIQEFGHCELVIEAVFEDFAVKKGIFESLEHVCSPDCIIATNTSTIPISTLASCLSPLRREKFIGMHYFLPAARMKLVEIIPGFITTQATIDSALRHCRATDKTPVLVKDVAGFAVNRMLIAFVNEAIRLVEEGVASPEDIDTACRLGLGHQAGPFEVMDATTSSLLLRAQEILFDAYGERFRPRPLLKQRVSAGFVGGRGQVGWLTK